MTIELRPTGVITVPSFATRAASASAAEVDAAVALIVTLTSSLNAALVRIDALEAEADAAIAIIQSGRPGDAPGLFMDNLAGGSPFERASAAYPVVNNVDGASMRIVGPGILAHKSMFALEEGRTWSVRFAGRRIGDSDDPEADAVDRGVAFYDKDKQILVVPDDRALMAPIAPTVGSGRWADQTTVSFGGGSDIIAPDNARYFRPYAETYGSTPITDIEVIWPTDITDFGGETPAFSDGV